MLCSGPQLVCFVSVYFARFVAAQRCPSCLASLQESNYRLQKETATQCQLCTKIQHTVSEHEYRPITTQPYVNEVTLRGQNLLLKCYQHLELLTVFYKGLDFSMLKIWGLLVKGLQSYQLSKLEVTRKSLPTGPGPSRTSRPGFELYRGQIILKV